MVRVITASGEQLGVMAISDALRLAREQTLDLVEVAATARPPVCRIMDFGKYKYEQAKREQRAKRRQHVTVVKEIKLRPRVEKHDFEFKLRHAREFLTERDRVKITIQFRGREVSHPELGYELMERVIATLADVAQVEQKMSMEGRFLTTMLSARPGVGAPPKPKPEEGGKPPEPVAGGKE
jgi:translation initiation factor IF-3